MTMSFVCWLLARHKYFAYTLKHELNTWKAMSGHDISLAITPAGAKRVLALTAPDIQCIQSKPLSHLLSSVRHMYLQGHNISNTE